MKLPGRLVLILLLAAGLIFAAPGDPLAASGDKTKDKQKSGKTYGRTPDRYLPFGKFAKPYKQFFLDPLEYHGYGRNLPEPESVESVKIGFLGPIEPTVSIATGGASNEEKLGKKMLQGATLAIEEANAAGGYRRGNVPYQLVVRNDNGLWGASGDEIIHLAYKDDVRAILGTIDGANSHIAIRVALKIEIPVVNTGDTDPTFTETAIPWVFRVITDDRQMCYQLADFVFKELKLTRIAALRANNRYGRIGIDEFRDAARRLGHPFLTELNYGVGDTDFTPQLQRIKSLNPEVVVTYGDAFESALLLKQMRAMGMNQWLIGSDRMVTTDFTEVVGPAHGKVAAGYPYNPTLKNPLYLQFKKKFEQRFGEAPETYAAHAYDGMTMLIRAIEAAGLNRAKIRDQLAKIKHYEGVTGNKEFDATYNNISPAALALLEQGRWLFFSSPGEVKIQTAYKRMNDEPRVFRGPVGHTADPSGLEFIPIGLFAPPERQDAEPAAASLYRGALLAVQQANARGGFHGVPFRLVQRWADEPWAAGSKEMIRLVYQDRVWAVIGSGNGACHIAQQIAAKAYVPVVAPVSTTVTLTRTGVPWIFRLPPDHRVQARVLVDKGIMNQQIDRIGLVSGSGHDSRTAARELQETLEQQRIPLLFHFIVKPDEQDLHRLVQRMDSFAPAALVLCLQPDVLSSLLKVLEASGRDCPVFLYWTPGMSAFQIDQLYSGPVNVLEPFQYREKGNIRRNYETFCLQFEQQFRQKPTFSAAYGYDAVQLIISSIRTNGLSRPGIRRGLEQLAGYQGVSGIIVWDNGGGNLGIPVLSMNTKRMGD